MWITQLQWRLKLFFRNLFETNSRIEVGVSTNRIARRVLFNAYTSSIICKANHFVAT